MRFLFVRIGGLISKLYGCLLTQDHSILLLFSQCFYFRKELHPSFPIKTPVQNRQQMIHNGAKWMNPTGI